MNAKAETRYSEGLTDRQSSKRKVIEKRKKEWERSRIIHEDFEHHYNE